MDVRIGSYGLIVRDGAILLTRLGELIGVHSLFVAATDRAHGIDRPLHALRIVYWAEIVGGNLSHEVAGSSDEAQWFGLDTIDQLHRLDLVDIALEMWRDRSAH